MLLLFIELSIVINRKLKENNHKGYVSGKVGLKPIRSIQPRA